MSNWNLLILSVLVTWYSTVAVLISAAFLTHWTRDQMQETNIAKAVVYFMNKRKSNSVVAGLWSVYTNRNIVIALVSSQIIEK